MAITCWLIWRECVEQRFLLGDSHQMTHFRIARSAFMYSEIISAMRAELHITVKVGDCGGTAGKTDASTTWIRLNPRGRPTKSDEFHSSWLLAIGKLLDKW